MSRKQPHHTPETSASQLMVELRAMNREARESIAELKDLLKTHAEMQEKARQEREALMEVINRVISADDARELILRTIHDEVDSHAEGIRKATTEARDVILMRFRQMATAMTGLPEDVFAQKAEFKMIPPTDSLLTQRIGSPKKKK